MGYIHEGGYLSVNICKLLLEMKFSPKHIFVKI